MKMAVLSKRRISEWRKVLDFWLDTRDDSIIYNYMEEIGAKKVTIEITSTYSFELEDDE